MIGCFMHDKQINKSGMGHLKQISLVSHISGTDSRIFFFFFACFLTVLYRR